MWVKTKFSVTSSFLIAILFLSCGKESTPTPPQKAVFTDSISYWLSSKKGSDKAVYIKNLQKALSAVEIEPNDSLKARYASQLSLKYLNLNDSLAFRKANKMALLWAKKIKDSEKMAEAHWDAAYFFEKRNVIDSSYYCYAKAHELYKSLGNDYNSARMLYGMSAVLSTIKDYTTAETYAIQAVEIFNSLEHEKKFNRLKSCYNQLGIIANNLKDYNKALEYHKKALEYLEIMDGDEIDLARSNNNIGAVYLAQGNYGLALEKFLTTLKTDSLYQKNTGLYAKALSNCGYSQFKTGDTTNIRYKFNRAIAITDSIGDLESLSRSYYTMSEFLLFKKDTLGARSYAEKAKKTAQQSGNSLRTLETLELLTKIDSDNGPTYFSEYVQLNDSLQIAERRSRNKFERIRFETNETIAENVLLSKQNQIWAAIAGVLLLLGIAAYVIIDQRRKNEKLRFEEEQQKTNKQIFDLLLSEKSKIEEGKKSAQKRISEELHDAVQSRLQGIRMLLLGLNKRNTPEAIEERSEAIKELKRVQEEVRAISHELSHAAYQRIYSFISTVQELLNLAKKNTQLQSNFIFDETFDWDDLDSDIKINVYRIIQESVQNCIKYAEAELLVLTFDVNGENILHVTIEDNGKGFRVKGRKKGIGMRNINSRVKKLNGKWKIQSEIGIGTTVILYIPILKTQNTSETIQMKIA